MIHRFLATFGRPGPATGDTPLSENDMAANMIMKGMRFVTWKWQEDSTAMVVAPLSTLFRSFPQG